MGKLFRLYAWSILEKTATELQECGAVELKHALTIREKSVGNLLEHIRPYAVPLVDSWNTLIGSLIAAWMAKMVWYMRIYSIVLVRLILQTPLDGGSASKQYGIFKQGFEGDI